MGGCCRSEIALKCHGSFDRAEVAMVPPLLPRREVAEVAEVALRVFVCVWM